MPATSISPQDPVPNASNVQAQMASTVDVFLSGGCLILCLGMIGFLLHTSNGAGFKVLYGTKNLYLVLLLAATSGYFAATSVEADSVADRAKSATRLEHFLRPQMQAAFFGLTAIFYINYSWIRSIGVLRQETSPTFVLVFKVILIATTVVCVLGPILVGLPVWEYETGTRYSRYAISGAGAGILLLDCYFSFAFARHIFKKTEEVIEFKGDGAAAAQYYPIISRYGCCATTSSFSALGFYIAATMVYVTGTESDPEVQQKASYHIFVVLCNICIFCIAVSLVSMKFKLVNAYRRAEER